jgi:Bifunctional DNA primase/polymerase, N-terminal
LANPRRDEDLPTRQSHGDIAIQCALRQLRVFPLHAVTTTGCSCKRTTCKLPGRHPRLDEWFAKATSKVTVVARWWKQWPEANVGVVAPEPGKFLCVDPTQPLPAHGDAKSALMMPSGQVFQGLQRAFFDPDKWTFSETDPPFYTDASTDLVYSYRGHRGADTSVRECESANRTLQENISILDPQTGLIAIICMAKWIAARQSGTLSPGMSVSVHVNEILDLMGRQKYHGAYRKDQKIEISRRFSELDAIKVSGPNPDPKAKNRRLRGSMFDVTFDDDFDLLKRPLPFAFIVRPGDAINESLIDGTMELADFFVSLAKLNTAAGGIERLAYQIGIYLVFQNRIRESTQNFEQPFRIGTILERQNVKIPTDARRFGKFREHVDAAFDRLRSDGVIADWRYVEGDEESLPTYGWFRRWLNCRIIIDPPTITRERARLRAASRREHIGTQHRALPPARSERR